MRYFAAAVEVAGKESEVVEADTVGQLAGLLGERYGDAMARILRTGSQLSDGIAVRDPNRPVGARLDVLPPFSGG